jgi:O-antigen ligase
VVSERGSENPAFGATASRFGSVGSNRYAYWRVALRTFADHPLEGTGAGSFRVDWLRERPFRESVRDAHSLYFETLAELGIVGFALLCALLAGVLLAVRRALADDRALATGPAAALVVWAVHAGVDWDWEMPAVTLLAVTLAAMLLAQGERRARER